MKKAKVCKMIGGAVAATIGTVIPTMIRCYYTPGGMLPWWYVLIKEAALVFCVFILAFIYGTNAEDAE